LEASDEGNLLQKTVAGIEAFVRVPHSSVTPFPIGFIFYAKGGVSPITIAPVTGGASEAVIQAPADTNKTSREPESMIGAIQLELDKWTVFGDVGAS